LKEEALVRNLWRARCGRGCGPVARRTVEILNHTTVARGIHVINSFISSYVQEYETKGATSELLQILSLFLNVKF